MKRYFAIVILLVLLALAVTVYGESAEDCPIGHVCLAVGTGIWISCEPPGVIKAEVVNEGSAVVTCELPTAEEEPAPYVYLPVWMR